MRLAVVFSALALAGLSLPAAGRADIPPLPKDLPAGKSPIPIQVSYDPDKDVSFLYIGSDVLKSAGEKHSRLEPGTTRSIVAASALSLGIAGVFLLRGKRRSQFACGLVLAASLGAIGVEAWGNAPAPQPNPPPPDTADAANFKPKAFHGDAVVEIKEGAGSHQIRLVIGTKPKPKYVRPRPPEAAPPPSEEKKI